MRRGLTLVEMLVAMAVTLIMMGAVAILIFGYRAADAMVVQPAETYALAVEAAGEEWTVTHSDAYSNKYHRYIVTKGGERRDVNVTRDEQGRWQAKLTPTFPR